MNGHPFQSFIALIEFDQHSLAIEKKIAQLRAHIVALHEQEHAAELQAQHAHMHILELRKQVDRAELEMKSFETEIKHVKQRLDAISSPREYQAINHELAMLNEQQLAKEELVMAAWAAYEATQKKSVADTAGIENKKKMIHDDILAQKALLIQEEVALRDRIHERMEKEIGIPQEWLDRYAAMRERVLDPVVPVDRGQCSACSQIVTGQDLSDLNRKKLLQCKGCFRFLYTDAIKMA